MTYGKGVYDVTTALHYHPESKDLNSSIGQSIDQHFDESYAFHKSDKILHILEKHRIGNVLEEQTIVETPKESNVENSDLKSHQIVRQDLPTFSAEDVSQHGDL